MPHGKATAHVAGQLGRTLSERSVDILFDHGQQGVEPPLYLGEIASWFGTDYVANAQLALLDIAVVQGNEDKAVALIEIEESAATPKVLLGDLFATLLGDHITFHRDRHLRIGKWTTLIVLVQAGGKGKRGQVAWLADRVRDLVPDMRSGNAAIGRVVVETFADADALERRVERLVREALARGGG